MGGCCKFGPFKKKRTYEFNNPPYSASKQDDVYHSHQHQKIPGDRGATVNGSTSFQEFDPKNNAGFEAESVDLDSECHSLTEDKNETNGFKSVGLVAASEKLKRKDSKRSSKSSNSSKRSSKSSPSSSSKHSSRSSKQSLQDMQADVDQDTRYAHTEASLAIIQLNTIETEFNTSEHVEEVVNEEVSEHVEAVAQDAEEEINEIEPEQHSALSTDAHSYHIEESYPDDGGEEVENNENEESVSSEDNSSGVIETAPGIEELENAANDIAQEGSYDVSEETEVVSVNAHGDDSEHVEEETDGLE